MSNPNLLPPRALLAPELDKPVKHRIILDALKLYRSHARLFASLVFLPTIAGTFFIWISQNQLTKLRNSIPNDMSSRLAAARDIHFLLKVWLLNISGYLGSWLCWAFAFVAVTVAVEEILAGRNPDPEECFNAVRGRPLAFLKTGVYLFAKMLLLFYVFMSVLFVLVFQVSEHFNIPLTGTNWYLIGVVEVLLIALVTLPFLFCIPVSIAEGLGLLASLRRSFTLTEGKSFVMLGLFIETEATAYLVSWLIRWIVYRSPSGDGIRVLYGGAFYLEVLITAFLQPIAMIGFAWIYVSRSRELQRQQAEHRLHAFSDSDEATQA